MTCFGADEHGYTMEEVFKILREELELLNVTKSNQLSLKRIHVVSNKVAGKLGRAASLPPQSKPKTMKRGHSTPAHAQVRATYKVISCSTSFQSVHVALYNGEITTQDADAMINILPNHPQLASKNSVCPDILQACGESFKDEMSRHIRSNRPRSIFTTSSGSIQNIKQILHIIPESSDPQALLSSLEHCLDFAKTLSAFKILIPVAEVMSLGISLKDLVNLILAAARRFSIDNSEALEVVILVRGRKVLDDLKSLFEHTTTRDVPSIDLTDDDDDVFANQEVENSSPVFLHNDDTCGISKSNVETKINIPTYKRREDKLLLEFVGLESSIYDSISEVMDFVERHKAKKSIHVRESFKFRQNHIQELEHCAHMYHVQIILQPCEITIEGVIHNVFECHEKITDWFNKYDKDEKNPAVEDSPTSINGKESGKESEMV